MSNFWIFSKYSYLVSWLQFFSIQFSRNIVRGIPIVTPSYCRPILKSALSSTRNDRAGLWGIGSGSSRVVRSVFTRSATDCPSVSLPGTRCTDAALCPPRKPLITAGSRMNFFAGTGTAGSPRFRWKSRCSLFHVRCRFIVNKMTHRNSIGYQRWLRTFRT